MKGGDVKWGGGLKQSPWIFIKSDNVSILLSYLFIYIFIYLFLQSDNSFFFFFLLKYNLKCLRSGEEENQSIQEKKDPRFQNFQTTWRLDTPSSSSSYPNPHPQIPIQYFLLLTKNYCLEHRLLSHHWTCTQRALA